MDEHAFPPAGFAVARLGCSLHLEEQNRFAPLSNDRFAPLSNDVVLKLVNLEQTKINLSVG